MVTQEDQLLESWKEIAAYLERSVRTCKRWEHALSLPIHRLDGTPRARVFAYSAEIDRWLAEKLHHIEAEDALDAREPVAPPSRRLRIRGIVLIPAGITAVVLIALLVRGLFHLPGLSLPDEKPSLAVLPFANETGEAAFEPWTTALPDMIAIDIGQSRLVNVVRITDLLRALAELRMSDAVRFSAADIAAVAAKTRVDHVVVGRFEKSDTGSVLALAIHPVRPLRTPRTSDPGDPAPSTGIRVRFAGESRAFSAADGATRKIKIALGLRKSHVSRDLDRDVDRISTASPAAFKLFSRGYRLCGLADYQAGISNLLEAVREDPRFALAYKYLFRACENSLREDDARTYALRAADLADRMSERESGEFIYLFHDRYTEGAIKKQQALERLCRFYPDDRFGSVLLLGLYARQERWDKGLPMAERAWAANKGEINPCLRLAQIYENTGRADRAKKVVGEFIDSSPGHQFLPGALGWRVRLNVRWGYYDEARADAGRLDELYPKSRTNGFWRAYISLHAGDFAEAEGELRALASASGPDDDPLEALLMLSDADLMRGRIEQSMAKLRQGFGMSVRGPGAVGEARANQRNTALHYALAHLYRVAGRPSDALMEIAAVNRAYSGSPQRGSVPLDLRREWALILIGMSRFEELEAQLEAIRLTMNAEDAPRPRRILENLLGHLAMAKGDAAAAITHFGRAADLVSVPGSGDRGADPSFFYDLAEAYARQAAPGWSDRAVKMFEKVIGPGVDRIGSGEIYALAHYHLARQLDSAFSDPHVRGEKLAGYRDEAVTHYRAFLDLWAGADAIFAPPVEVARRRLAELESASR